MTRGKGIAKLYMTGGANMLAYRLGRIFTKIETEEQRILHNDVLAEVLDIINKTDRVEAGKLLKEEHDLLKFVADWVLYKTIHVKIEKRKRLLFRLAEWVLRLGSLKA